MHFFIKLKKINGFDKYCYAREWRFIDREWNVWLHGTESVKRATFGHAVTVTGKTIVVIENDTNENL